MGRFGCGAIVLLGLVRAAAADEEGDLYSEFVSLARAEDEDKARTRRTWILYELKQLKNARAREFLFKALAKARYPDEGIVTIRYLGAVRDTAHLDALLKYARKSKDPALLSALAEALGGAKSDAAKKLIVTRGLKEKREVVQAACCRAISRGRWEIGKRPLRELAARLVRGSRHLAGAEAVAALASFEATDLEKPVQAALRSKNHRMRLAVADGLARRPRLNPSAQAALRNCLRDRHPAVRRGTLLAVGQKKHQAFTPWIIGVLERDTALSCRAVARHVLEKLSGRKLGYDAAAWRAWWKDKSVVQRAGRKPAFSVVRYYGHRIVTDNVCFIVDLSSSMRLPKGRSINRMSVAKKELLRALGKLGEKTRFNIVTYSDEAAVWKEKGAVRATKGNVAAAAGWIRDTFRPRGKTNLYDAVRLALAANRGVDTLFLLTDGLPTAGEYRNYEGVRDAVESLNRFRRVRMNTIVLTLDTIVPKDDLSRNSAKWRQSLMQKLARMSGAECRIVRKPPR